MTHHIRTVDDIAQLGSIVSVWAHPDDETFTCAGIMAAAIANKQSVACITATKGEAGVQDEHRWPAARLGNIREAELDAALRILGVHHHYWLPYKDGHCAEADVQEASQQLADFFKEYKPDTILTFGPDGFTGHRDHQTVSEWVNHAVKQLDGVQPTIYHVVQLRETYEQYLRTADKQFDIFFNIAQPPLFDADDCDVCFKLPKDICQKKCQALKTMASQYEKLVAYFGDDKLMKVFAQETFIKR